MPSIHVFPEKLETLGGCLLAATKIRVNPAHNSFRVLRIVALNETCPGATNLNDQLWLGG
jgi:hypothetical protein